MRFKDGFIFTVTLMRCERCGVDGVEPGCCGRCGSSTVAVSQFLIEVEHVGSRSRMVELRFHAETFDVCLTVGYCLLPVVK